MNNGAFLKKSIYSHVLAATLDGRVETIARWLVANGFQALWPKVADGPYPFRWRSPFSTGPYAENLTAGMVEILHSFGLQVIGWGFLYGKNPIGEASRAVSAVKTLHLDGYILDAEGVFDSQLAAVANAYTITRIIKDAVPDVPLALCSWPRIWSPKTGKEWHPLAVAQAFMADCDVITPMTYWDGESPVWAAEFLQQSHDQWRRITDKPIIPAGRAYTGDAGKPTKEAIAAFQARADALILGGVSWWCLDQAVKNPIIRDGLAATHQYTVEVPPVERLCPTCGQAWPNA
jgi:hypothetical protein